MKWIIYSFKSAMLVFENGEAVEKEIICKGKIPYSDDNLEYVKKAAIDGAYTIEEDGSTASNADDVLNALLGVRV